MLNTELTCIMQLTPTIVKWRFLNTMHVLSTANSRIWLNPDLLMTPPESSFDAEFWQQRDAVIGSAKGRGTTWFVKTDKLEMALRHYRRGGLFGRLVADSYVFLGWEKTRCAQELALLQRLVDGGVNVPRPVAARAVRHGCYYQADILVEKVPNASDLVAVLKQRSLSQDEWLKVGALIRQMHDLQVCHTDLNIHNILMDGEGAFWLIDFDKCYQSKGDSWKAGNLQRLLRSLHKELKKCGILWQESHWAYLEQGYTR